MANTQGPFGFRPVRRVDAADWSASIETRQVLNTDTTAIGRGDVVKALASGYLKRATSADNALAAPGVMGIFWGCEYYDTALQRPVFSPNWTGVSTALAGSVQAQFIADPRVIFQVQVGGSSTPVGIADLGAVIGILDGTIASNGYSTQGVDQTVLDQTNTRPFKIWGLDPTIGNDNTSAYNTIWVVLNNASMNSTTGI